MLRPRCRFGLRWSVAGGKTLPQSPFRPELLLKSLPLRFGLEVSDWSTLAAPGKLKLRSIACCRLKSSCEVLATVIGQRKLKFCGTKLWRGLRRDRRKPAKP